MPGIHLTQRQMGPPAAGGSNGIHVWTRLLGTWACQLAVELDIGHPAAGTRVDIVTRVPSWYMEEEVARGLDKDRRH